MSVRGTVGARRCSARAGRVVAAVLGASLAAGAAAPSAAAPQAGAAVAPRVVITGKPVGPFGLRYELVGEPRLGEPLGVRIALSPDIVLENVTLTLSGPAALVIDTPLLQVPRIEPGARYEHVVTVTPFAAEALDLRLIVEAVVGGLRQAQAVLIPVRLAAAKSRAPANLKPDPDAPDGARIHSLPGVRR